MHVFRTIRSAVKKYKNACDVFMKKLTQKKIITIDNIQFYTPSELCAWRAKTLFTKEPETLKWIDTFDSNDIFWDIGANIGIYTIYAAVKKNVKVFAFEPSPFNFYVLSKNVYLNKMSPIISLFCLAFTNKTALDYLNLTSINEGAAHTSFQTTVNEFGESFTPQYSQSTMGFSCEDFLKIFKISPPTHIKIDVDGAEKLVIDGAKSILKDPQVKSILIEMNSQLQPDEEIIFDTIIDCGFSLERSDHPDNDKRLSNYIFRRR